MAFDIFGFTLAKKPKKDVGTFITPENDDGAITYVEGGGFVGTGEPSGTHFICVS